ncbi:MAG: hypothetical protein ABR588_09740 [Sphingomicrobium sp.]|nr:hypothetical protein [Sphingomonadales bacterium]
MRSMRSATVLDPTQFGRRVSTARVSAAQRQPSDSFADLKLFALTFLGGFMFVAIYLG